MENESGHSRLVEASGSLENGRNSGTVPLGPLCKPEAVNDVKHNTVSNLCHLPVT